MVLFIKTRCLLNNGYKAPNRISRITTKRACLSYALDDPWLGLTAGLDWF